MIQSSHQNGFSLIEVMVSVTLLTASMMGLAALQNVSTKFDHQAYIRSQSVIQAGDMVDRMRANTTGVNDGFYHVDPAPESFSKNCSLVGSTCTPQELANFDIVSWNTQNADLLPNGFGTISYVTVSTYQVNVSWNEQQDEETVGASYSKPCDSSDETLRCYKMSVRL